MYVIGALWRYRSTFSGIPIAGNLDISGGLDDMFPAHLLRFRSVARSRKIRRCACNCRQRYVRGFLGGSRDMPSFPDPPLPATPQYPAGGGKGGSSSVENCKLAGSSTAHCGVTAASGSTPNSKREVSSSGRQRRAAHECAAYDGARANDAAFRIRPAHERASHSHPYLSAPVIIGTSIWSHPVWGSLAYRRRGAGRALDAPEVLPHSANANLSAAATYGAA